MADLSKPLSPSELSDLKAKAKAKHIAAPETILRLIDMVERRDAQIGKLRAALKMAQAWLDPHEGTSAKGGINDCCAAIANALASIEPPAQKEDGE